MVGLQLRKDVLYYDGTVFGMLEKATALPKISRIAGLRRFIFEVTLDGVDSNGQPDMYWADGVSLATRPTKRQQRKLTKMLKKKAGIA